MSRVVVLGGCGTVGSIAVETLASYEDISSIVIADIREDAAKKRAESVDGDLCLSRKVDVTVRESLEKAIQDADVVLNTCGPFYRFGPTILSRVIDAGIDYVDVCDDFDATRKLLDMDDDAKKVGISALTGMGSSPGIANLLAKFCADHMLDSVDSIDIYHAHGGEPNEGRAVVAHRIHSMQADIPMYLDGKFTTVRYFAEDGKALEEDVDYKLVGTHRSYPYPHPETITLPQWIECNRVTNLGCVLPDEYYDLIRGIVHLGITEEAPIDVSGDEVEPLEFAISYILDQREKILQKTNFGEQRGCLKITMKGTMEGKAHRFDFSLASKGQSMGEGTGIPAALGVILMLRGKIQKKGVLPPEGCVNPLDFLGLMQEQLKMEKVGGEGSPLIIESTNREGNTEEISL
ncbi:MAG: saccharopine dehydrogenase NADP-binding domain-containing protein [Candidatus Thorarchaeota archaeon]|nr:saccharopine dehydrogenase NADP-binding domain-containing protein [Candidatus Thorarchaeota archaeon]